MHITFVTGNSAKAAQLAHHLATPVEHKKLDLAEIQSLDLEKVVRDKAQRAWDILHSPVLVEDSSLTLASLGKLPGPLIKWFLEELGNDGITRLVDNRDRSATAGVLFALHDGTTCQVFSGSVVGQIAEIARGERGFGWDPIFIPDGHNKTWAEMSPEEQSATSMRRITLQKLQTYLQQSRISRLGRH